MALRLRMPYLDRVRKYSSSRKNPAGKPHPTQASHPAIQEAAADKTDFKPDRFEDPRHPWLSFSQPLSRGHIFEESQDIFEENQRGPASILG